MIHENVYIGVANVVDLVINVKFALRILIYISLTTTLYVCDYT